MLAIIGMVCCGLVGCVLQEDIRIDTAGPRRTVAIGDPREAIVQQQTGRLKAGTEGTADSSNKASRSSQNAPSSAPVSCGQQNSADPACHAATQQARPPGR